MGLIKFVAQRCCAGIKAGCFGDPNDEIRIDNNVTVKVGELEKVYRTMSRRNDNNDEKHDGIPDVLWCGRGFLVMLFDKKELDEFEPDAHFEVVKQFVSEGVMKALVVCDMKAVKKMLGKPE